MTDRILVEGSPRATDDAWRLVAYRGPEFIAAARRARNAARHYNDFRVGVYAIGVSERLGRVCGIGAANRNLDPGTNPSKRCAEPQCLRKARDWRLDHIVALFVSGPPQPDTQSGIATPTLHCCGQCRGRLAVAPEIRPDTLLVTAHPDTDAYEANTFREVQAIHCGENQPSTAYSDPGFEVWEAGAVAYDRYGVQSDTTGVDRATAVRLAVTGQLSPPLGSELVAKSMAVRSLALINAGAA